MTHRKLLAVVSMAMAVTFATTPLTPVLAASRAEVRYHQRKAAEKRKIIQRKAREADRIVAETRKVEAQISAMTREYRKVDGRVRAAQQRRRQLRHDIRGLRARIAAKEKEIERARESISRQEMVLGGRAESLYKSGPMSFVDLVLGAKDFGDLVTRLSLASAIMTQDKRVIEEFDAQRRAYETAKRQLDADIRSVEAKERQVAAEEMTLRTLRSRQDRTLKKLWSARARKRGALAETQANIARVRAALDAEEAESARIEAELRAAAARAAAARAAARAVVPRRRIVRVFGRTVYRAPAPVRRTPSYGGGGFMKPVAGRISSQFGWRMHPVLGYRRFHSGVDMAAGSGTPIRAAGSGRVIYAGYRGGYGNTVMIDHGGGKVTLYAHQSRIAVRGGSVGKGQVIGYVGSTGMSTGPHLHFEVRVNGSPVNPLNYI